MKLLNIPFLLLRGQYDNQKWGYFQEYLNYLPDVTFKIIPKSGHFIEIEQPALFYSEIEAFLKEKG